MGGELKMSMLKSFFFLFTRRRFGGMKSDEKIYHFEKGGVWRDMKMNDQVCYW